MTCKRIARLLSEQLDHELPLSRRIAIRLHLSWCIFCRRLAKHLVMMHQLCRAVGETSAAETQVVVESSLSPEARERMKKLLST
jgi:predicted anti-sigma-YlaC factor YlaD